MAEKRVRTQTEKGREYQLQLIENELRNAQREWSKQLNKLRDMISDSDDPEKLRTERIYLETRWEIVSSVYDRIAELRNGADTGTDANSYTEKFDNLLREHNEAI